MIKDLIISSKLKQATEQDFVRIECCGYVHKDGRILIFGHPVVEHKYYKNHFSPHNEKFIYAFECELDDLKSGELFKKITEYTQTPIIYDTWWRDENQYFLQSPYKQRFCSIGNVDIKTLHWVEYRIKRYKEKAEQINTPSFKACLKEWINTMLETWKLKGDEPGIFDSFNFINNMDYLLFADDDELGDLYLKYQSITGQHSAALLQKGK